MSDKLVIILCSILAVIIFAVSLALAVANKRNPKRVIRIFGAGVFLMLVVLICPSYSIQKSPFVLGLALMQSMAAMLLNANAGEILAAFDGYTLSFIGVYKAILLALLIIAPLFTVGITLSFFSGKFTRLIYRIRSLFRPSYLFFEINERTLFIAEEVAKKNKKAIIVFAVNVEKDAIDASWLDRIKKIGTIINEDIVNISHSLRHERNYYLLCSEGRVNLDAGLRLYQKYNQRKAGTVNMWLYTTDEISEVIFDHLYETFNVRILREEDMIAKSLVVNYPLYNAVNNGKLSVLIIGSGKIGLEILRTVTACSCLGGKVKVELNVVDANAEKARITFEKSAPLLAKKWNIKFHEADVNTSRFTEVLNDITPTYIVLALGNQNINIETAIYIRRIYGTEGGFPHIHALVDNKRFEEQILPNLCVTYWTYDKEQVKHIGEELCSFDIKPFGAYEDTYSNLRIGASYLDCLAVAHNAAYCGITEINDKYTPEVVTNLYNQIMFFKQYSDGFAISVDYKLYLMGLMLCDDGMGDLTLLDGKISENIKLLHEHEDKRHEAFMRGNGWMDLPVSEVKGGIIGDKLKKRNARLDNTHIEKLSKLTGRNFAKEDEDSIYNLTVIIKLANALYGKNYSVRDRL